MQALRLQRAQAPDTTDQDSNPDQRLEAMAPPIRKSERPQWPACPRKSHGRVHLIYADREPEAARQARELVNLVVTSEPNARGAWIPASHLWRFYLEHRKAHGLPRLPWVAIARHLKSLAPKRNIKRNGRRRVCYQMPRRQLEGS